jgi:hypothetical protein
MWTASFLFQELSCQIIVLVAQGDKMKKTILLLLVFIFAACSIGSSELSRNQQKWNDANITHYRFSLNIGCFCAFRDQMPLTVEVLNGEVVSIAKADGSMLDKADANYEYYSTYSTIDHLFTELESDSVKNADEVTVKYDATYGFPTDINIDFIKAAMDDELHLSVSEFKTLP